jgi:TPR repeat protein
MNTTIIDSVIEKYINHPDFDELLYNEAKSGDNVAIHNIGCEFMRIGMMEEAIVCWEFLVQKGNANADSICNLGVSYFYGNGVPQDYKKAVYYYQRAAALGHSFGQYNLAVALEQGKGIQQDMSRAIMFFEKSAKAGNNNAIDALIRLGLYNEMYIAFYARNLDEKCIDGDKINKKFNN